MTSIFLSHSSSDKEFVRRLARDIARHGGIAWVDEAEMRIGDSLVKKIGDGIDASEFLGVVLSPTSVRSEWVQREVEIAINQEIQGRRVKVLPLLKRKCDIPAFLNGKIYADFSRSSQYHDALRQVVSAMGLDPENRNRVPGNRMVLVRDFREKIASYFAPRRVEIEFFDDGSGIDNITVWNEDKTFELYSWETMPTDTEIISRIFRLEGQDQIREIQAIEGGPFSVEERDQIISRLRETYEIPAELELSNWNKSGEAGTKAKLEYDAWLFEVSTLCLSNRPL